MHVTNCLVTVLVINSLAVAQAQPPSGPRLDEAAVERFARLALDCIHREYPNKISHVLNSDRDVRPPRELTPLFHGCFDWHSAVHGHWLLVRLCRMYPDAAFAAETRAALSDSFTAENAAVELEYLSGEGRKAFERPYGLAWLLLLCAELHEWDDPRARQWAAVLEPLEQVAAERFEEWLPKLSHPVRTGEHSQTAFALGLAHDWAVLREHYPLQVLIEERARVYYMNDRDANPAFEPGGEDFLSPIIAEADLMRRILPPRDFAAWLGRFLPNPEDEKYSRWLTPAIVTDKSDGKLVHLDGLNLSRAWMLEGVASGLPSDSPYLPMLQAAAAAHREAGLAAIMGQHYEGGHWLGSFATYLVTARYVPAQTIPERQQLFNGTDLEGWVQRGGQARFFAENGMIVGASASETPNSFLCTERQFGDFDLELEFRIDPRLNSGIQIRGNSFSDYLDGRVHGYQVEIDPSERAWTGGIYDESRRGWLHSLAYNEPARKAFIPEGWNRLRILAIGDRIQTWLNGVNAADLIDSMTQTGFIALQVHETQEAEPLTACWRNIHVRELGQHVWQPLYDGETLNSWHVSKPDVWRIEPAALIGAVERADSAGTLLQSKDLFTDTTVRFKYKILRGVARLCFRGLRIDLAGEKIGTIRLEGVDKALAEPPADGIKSQAADEWTMMTLSVHGRRVAVHLNNQRLADCVVAPLSSPSGVGLELDDETVIHVQSIEQLTPVVQEERPPSTPSDDAVGMSFGGVSLSRTSLGFSLQPVLAARCQVPEKF